MPIADDRDPRNDNPQGYAQLPNSIELEQTVLGTVLIDNRAYEAIAERVAAEHFFDPVHARLWEVISRTITAGVLASPVTISPIVKDWPSIAPDLTVGQYLGRLAGAAMPSNRIRDYAKSLTDLATRRQMISVAQYVIERAMDTDAEDDADKLVEIAEQELYAITQRKVEGREVTLGQAARNAVESIARAYERGGRISGVETRLADLDERTGGLENSDLIVLAGRPSMGKEQPMDAPILMADGKWKLMGEIRIGDKVASYDGRPSTVTGVFPQGVKQIYRIKFKDGRTAEAGADHLWRIMYRAWREPRIVNTTRLSEMLGRQRYRGRLWIDTVSGDFGSDGDLPLDPYVLGSLIANGSFRNATIRLSTPHSSIVERIARSLENCGCTLNYQSGVDWSIVGTGRDNAITKAVKSLGLYGLKSEDKFIPPAYLSSPRTVRVKLLQGLMDGDGWVEKAGGMCYGTSSHQLALDVRSLVRSLGGLSTISEKFPKYTHNGEMRAGLKSYVVYMSFKDGREFVNIPSKSERVAFSRTQRLTVTSITKSRVADAQCITVSHPDHLYVTSDYVVTHNTALATIIADNVSQERTDADGNSIPGLHVHFFSQEMTSDQLAKRLIAERTEISSERLRRGQVSEDEFRQVVRAAEGLSRSAFTVDETGGISLAALAAKARRTKRRKNTGLIVIDYLQLMSGSNKRGSNRTNEITEITTGLKALAKELNVPIIALSQLSRNVEGRADKRPQLSDLRESGSIEQDADVVLFVYREEYYVEREKPDESDPDKYIEWQTKMDRCRGRAEVIIGKHRHAPVGIVEMAFQAQFTRFSNLSRSNPTGGF